MASNVSNYDRLLKEIYKDVLNISDSKGSDVELDDNYCNDCSGENILVDEDSNAVSNRLKRNWLLINEQNAKRDFLSASCGSNAVAAVIDTEKDGDKTRKTLNHRFDSLSEISSIYKRSALSCVDDDSSFTTEWWSCMSQVDVDGPEPNGFLDDILETFRREFRVELPVLTESLTSQFDDPNFDALTAAKHFLIDKLQY